MENIPLYIPIFFGIITFTAIVLFFRASGHRTPVLLILLSWLIIQAAVSLTGFYKITGTIPPRFALLIIPPLVLIIFLMFSSKGKKFISQLDLKTLTWIHILRIPVELVLYSLFIYKAIPQIMTFEGRNWDILSGISVPFIIYFGFRNGNINRRLLLVWNIISLALLLNIVTIAVLTVPFPFRTFPFIWLPCLVVPLVLFSHLIAISRLITNPKKSLVQMQHSF